MDGGGICGGEGDAVTDQSQVESAPPPEVPRCLGSPPRFLFFTGKGGVGKTSIACATAIRLADQCRRVLLVSTDPASNLAEVLATPVGSLPTPVDGAAGLTAVNIDPEASAESYRDRILTPLAGTLPEAELTAAREQLSGFCTTEVAAFDEFTTYLGQPSADTVPGGPPSAGFDHIVFDTAPTGHTIRLLQLPGAWTSFLATGKGDASCLGPLAGLDKHRGAYAAALAALRDPGRARIVLVTRAQPSALAEAARTAAELTEAGIAPTHLVINGLLPRSIDDERDPLYRAIRDREQQALARMPASLGTLATDRVAYCSPAPIGLASLRAVLAWPRQAPHEGPIDESVQTVPGRREELDALVDELEEAGHGLVLCMGKGGVGKTTVAAALAVALAGRGHAVHLSTTDPAAHLDRSLPDMVPGLTVSRIDPAGAIAAYRDHVMATRGRDATAEERVALAEDLRSPCNDEIAVFTQFAKVIREARRGYVVLDTAPTGHTLLLLDATGSYHRDAVRLLGPDATGYRTPLMMLQDPSLTRVLIVTTPEQTPVSEAAALQADLARAGIAPWGWVVNNSVAAAHPNSPLLRQCAAAEYAQLHRVDQLAARVAVLPSLPADPVGHDLLTALIHDPAEATT
jgi:arsenite-transporting ATPase